MQNKGTKTLVTDRLILRQFRRSDASAMFENWASDPAVTEFLTWPSHTDISVTEAVLDSWIAGYEDPSYYNWAMELKDQGEIIGNISVVKLEEQIEAAEIGYCMGKAWWGQSLMPEALKAVIAFLFGEVGLNRIGASHDSNNPGSGRVMDKAGMKMEGTLRAAAMRKGVIYDRVWHSLLKNEWQAGCMEGRMLAVRLNRENYEYDIQALLKSFYPGEQLRVITPASRDQEIHEGEQEWNVWVEEPAVRMQLAGKDIQWRHEEKEGPFKDCFKRFFYRFLAEITGRELPWGNLTGIRPTKLAYAMLEEGKQDQEIVEELKRTHYVSREKCELSIEIARRERELLSGIHYQGGYSLYIGIPFCPSTCLYCSFTSYPIAAYQQRVDQYIDCVIREMEYVSRRYKDKILDAVYIGGGTPTTLEPEQLDRLLGSLKTLFDFTTVQEFTVEAGRADSITREKLEVLYRHGVGRISVNPQTMKQETLDIIGRKAAVEQVLAAYRLAREVGFDNINMDLILGLPGEDEADVQHTIDQVVDLAPDSLTVHSLAIKRASRLNQWIQEHGIEALRNTDETMEIAAAGAKALDMHPYYLYRQKNMSGNFENVGYAREGKYGLYNILIMEEVQTIIACGAGSISKRVYPDGRIERCENVKDVAQYIERIGEMIERKRVLLED